MLADGGLRDSAVGFGFRNTWHRDISFLPIDHVLISKGMGVSKRTIGPQMGSDHQPLVVDLHLPAGNVPQPHPHPKALSNTHEPGDVDIPENVKFIVADPKTLAGIVLDETDAVLEGDWQYSTHTPPYVGIGYLHDQSSGNGKKSVTWQPDIPEAGKYEVRVSHCYNVRRATNTPVTIRHAGGDTLIRINQQDVPEIGNLFRSLGVFEFEAGKSGALTISNTGTAGKYVIADAVQFIPVAGE